MIADASENGMSMNTDTVDIHAWGSESTRGDDFKRAIFWAKYRCFRRQAIPFYRNLVRNQYLSSDEIQHINWSKRRNLLADAYERSPFYRKKYISVGLHPSDVKRPEDFEKVPCLTREELRSNGDQILTSDAKSGFLATKTTGGSTGVPVRVMFDKRVPTEAIGWRMMSWWGIEPHMDGAYVWRMQRTTHWGMCLNRVLWWPTAKLRMDAASMSEESMRRFISRFCVMRPPLLQGYTGAIHHLALEIASEGLTVHSPKAVWVTASPMSEAQRQSISRAFRAPVYDQYGSCEVGWYAAECRERNGLHINSDTVHIEFTDRERRAAAAGETGDIVVTDLHNTVFPLIRYVNGDRGRALPGRCACGVALPLMDQVRGRASDMIRLPSGRAISGEYLTTIFDAFPDAVKQFQVRQDADASITVLYVQNSEYSGLPVVLRNVRSSLETKTHHEVTVSLKEAKAISHDRGKHRFVISDFAG
jgi:phenylacetate-CoA ligase